MSNYNVSEELKNLIECIFLFPIRFRQSRNIQNKRKVSTEALIAARRTLQSATQLNAISTKTVFNVALYLLLLDQDISFYAEDLVCAIGDRRRAFITKQEAVLLFEAAEDLPQLLGRDFRDAVTKLGASAEQIDKINVVSSELNQFW